MWLMVGLFAGFRWDCACGEWAEKKRWKVFNDETRSLQCCCCECKIETRVVSATHRVQTGNYVVQHPFAHITSSSDLPSHLSWMWPTICQQRLAFSPHLLSILYITHPSKWSTCFSPEIKLYFSLSNKTLLGTRAHLRRTSFLSRRLMSCLLHEFCQFKWWSSTVMSDLVSLNGSFEKANCYYLRGNIVYSSIHHYPWRKSKRSRTGVAALIGIGVGWYGSKRLELDAVVKDIGPTVQNYWIVIELHSYFLTFACCQRSISKNRIISARWFVLVPLSGTNFSDNLKIRGI